MQKQASDVVAAAEKKAKKLLDDAKNAADAIQRTVVKAQKTLEQREADVSIRESAVAHVDAQLKQLDSERKQLAKMQEAARDARASAEAEKTLWQTRQKELDAKAVAQGKPTSAELVRPVEQPKKSNAKPSKK